jgi:hypothetical protein
MNVQPNLSDIRRAEAVEPEVDLWALTDPAVPFAIRVAATLRVADLIDAGHTRLADLAAKAGVDAEMLGRVMRFLTCRGIFRETAPDIYALNKTAERLKDSHPGMFRAWMDLEGMGGRMDLCFSHMLEVVRTGEPAYPGLFGRTIYDDSESDAERAHNMGVLMAHVSSWFARATVKLDWSGVNHLVDVAGGTGTQLSMILKAHPAMRGTLFDQPKTAAEAAQKFAELGLADRCGAVGGSYRDPLPAGADMYMLSQIVHNLNDRDSEIVLRRCAVAGGPGKRVRVLDRIARGDEDQKIVTGMDLRMMVVFGAKERSVEQFRELGARAGLTLLSTAPLTAGMSALDFVIAG